MSAFRAAVERGLPIELDVRLLADEQVAVFHDETLDRMTSSSAPIRRLSARQLRELRLSGSDERVPLLSEVLQLVAGRVALVIELKHDARVGRGRLEQCVWRELGGYRGDYAVMSFHPMVVGWFRRNAPQVTRGQLSGRLTDAKLSRLERFALRNLLLTPVNRPHFVAYDVTGLPALPVSLWRRITHNPVLAWTVRDEAEARRADRYADNLIFDQIAPETLVALASDATAGEPRLESVS